MDLVPLIVNGLIGHYLPVLKLVTQDFKPKPDTKKLKHNMEERNVLEIPLKLNFATMDLVQQLKHQLCTPTTTSKYTEYLIYFEFCISALKKIT